MLWRTTKVVALTGYTVGVMYTTAGLVAGGADPLFSFGLAAATVPFIAVLKGLETGKAVYKAVQQRGL